MPLDTTQIDTKIAQVQSQKVSLQGRMNSAATAKRQDKVKLDKLDKKLSHLRAAKRQMGEFDKL